MPGEYRLLPVPMFNDNYLWLWVSPDGQALAVDVGDYALLASVLQSRSWRLTTVFVTHRHADHTAGLAELAARHPEAVIYGPGEIGGVTHPVCGGEMLQPESFGEWRVLAVPGHTNEHLAFYHPGQQVLFCGDTLFSMGCGRVFDGDPEALFRSLELIYALPDNTRICCAHEYTLANLDFALAIEPGNTSLREYRTIIESGINQGIPSLPALLELEKRLNPYLRTHDPAFRRVLRNLLPEMPGTPSASEAFVALRRFKDTWKPAIR
ncbi:MAG TPA: hydroxyacylglutathione hydrolase [Fluviicoccus sp.]|nr:hydroxyacylglutathione hydrolase [Fluviicoccus sp.]